MSTIAFDGKTLAADCAMTSGGMKYRYTGKIKRLTNGCLVGFAGTVTAGQLLMDWLETANTKKLVPTDEDDDVEALFVTPTGEIATCYPNGEFIWLGEKVASIGTGAPVAMGALLAGASAIQAVEFAIQRDPNSGFEVISLTF